MLGRLDVFAGAAGGQELLHRPRAALGLSALGARRSAEGVTASVAARDKADSNRNNSPLMVAEGAVVLDNSDHTVASAVAAALDILRGQGLALND